MAKLRREVREKKYGRHSPAGYRYLQRTRKKKKEIQETHLSRQGRKQLQGLSGGDYAEVMKILRKK